MPSNVFKYTKSDYDADIKDNSVTHSFDKEKGEYTVSFEIRNPRIATATISVGYTLDGGSYQTVPTADRTVNDQNSNNFGCFPPYKRIDYVWKVWKTLPLTKHTNTVIKVRIWDDSSNLTNANLMHNVDTTVAEIDLEPKVTDVLFPKDFGEGGSTDFIFRVPTLKRNQKIKPSLRLSTSEDMSNPTTYNTCAFNISSVNQITKIENGGEDTISVEYSPKSGNALANGDTVAITGTTHYDGTYSISGVSNNSCSINADYKEDEDNGLICAANLMTFGSPTTGGLDLDITAGIAMKVKFAGINLTQTQYYDVSLNCEETS